VLFFLSSLWLGNNRLAADPGVCNLPLFFFTAPYPHFFPSPPSPISIQQRFDLFFLVLCLLFPLESARDSLCDFRSLVIWLFYVPLLPLSSALIRIRCRALLAVFSDAIPPATIGFSSSHALSGTFFEDPHVLCPHFFFFPMHLAPVIKDRTLYFFRVAHGANLSLSIVPPVPCPLLFEAILRHFPIFPPFPLQLFQVLYRLPLVVICSYGRLAPLMWALLSPTFLFFFQKL